MDIPRLAPRTSPVNALDKLPWVRRKKLGEQFVQDPDRFTERFDTLFKAFQRSYCRFKMLKQEDRRRRILFFQLKKLSRDMMDFIECGVFQFDEETKYFELRERLQRFL